MEKSFGELKKREWPCDIHILDFLTDNYKRTQLFYSPNHPTNNVLSVLTQRILHFMDISDTNFGQANVMNPMDQAFSVIGQDIPVYPKVASVIGLQEYFVESFANAYMWPFRANYLDFLLEYAKQCWADKLKE